MGTHNVAKRTNERTNEQKHTFLDPPFHYYIDRNFHLFQLHIFFHYIFIQFYNFFQKSTFSSRLISLTVAFFAIFSGAYIFVVYPTESTDQLRYDRDLSTTLLRPLAQPSS